MKINKKFWLQVYKEYHSSVQDSHYICHKSVTFLKEWDTLKGKREEIRNIAEKFLIENSEIKEEFGLYTAVGTSLFYASSPSEYLSVQPTRTAFLEWVIKQY